MGGYNNVTSARVIWELNLKAQCGRIVGEVEAAAEKCSPHRISTLPKVKLVVYIHMIIYIYA